MGKNFNPLTPEQEAAAYAAWMTMPPDPKNPVPAPLPGEVETTEWGDLESGSRALVTTTWREPGTPPEVEVTEWDGITFADNSHVLATVAGDKVKVSAMNAEGEEVLVTLDWATAKAVADVLAQASTNAFNAGHAAWMATRRPEIEG